MVNEHEQLVAAPLTYSSKNAELEPTLRQLRTMQIATNQKTFVAYFDNPEQMINSLPLEFESGPHPAPLVPP
jgi:hypothetical protein